MELHVHGELPFGLYFPALQGLKLYLASTKKIHVYLK